MESQPKSRRYARTGGCGQVLCRPPAWRSHTRTHRFWPGWPPGSTGLPGRGPPPRAIASGRAPILGEARSEIPAPGWVLQLLRPPPGAALAAAARRASYCRQPNRPPGTAQPPARCRRRRLPAVPRVTGTWGALPPIPALMPPSQVRTPRRCPGRPYSGPWLLPSKTVSALEIPQCSPPPTPATYFFWYPSPNLPQTSPSSDSSWERRQSSRVTDASHPREVAACHRRDRRRKGRVSKASATRGGAALVPGTQAAAPALPRADHSSGLRAAAFRAALLRAWDPLLAPTHTTAAHAHWAFPESRDGQRCPQRPLKPQRPRLGPAHFRRRKPFLSRPKTEGHHSSSFPSNYRELFHLFYKTEENTSSFPKL